MRKIFIELNKPYNKEFIIELIENGVDALFLSNKTDSDFINNLGKIDLFFLDNLPKEIKFIEINSNDDVKKMANESKEITLIVKSNDWKIIPLENLIASNLRFYYIVSTLGECTEVSSILEKGVYGLYIKSTDNTETVSILKSVKQKRESLNLSLAKIVDIQKLLIGDRVCVDTTTELKEGEGALVGTYSNELALIGGETLINQYIETRPFRVNCGAISSYIMTDNNTTKYLSELKTGDTILIVNYSGESRLANVARIKQEKRPLLQVKLVSNKKEFNLILQNAETVSLIERDGKQKPISSLSNGDEVLFYQSSGGRHFGIEIEETIIEK